MSSIFCIIDMTHFIFPEKDQLQLLQSGCPDCIVMQSDDLMSGLILLSKDKIKILFRITVFMYFYSL